MSIKMIIIVCDFCCKSFEKNKQYYNNKKNNKGQIHFYCSKECIIKAQTKK